METKELSNKEASKKLKSLVESIETGMLITALNKTPLDAVPMTHKKIDEKGDIWFLSPGDSDHNKNIAQNNLAQLLYSSPADKKFISIYGEIQIVVEQKILEDLYADISNNWFNGVDDPNLTALKFTPKEAYYWDTKTNKYISLLKLGFSAISGEETDIGEKGKLNV